MPKPVRCDVCGKLYSSSHLGSHKRLAHAKDKLVGSVSRERAIQTIVEIYNTLSSENKKRVLKELTSIEQRGLPGENCVS